MNDSDPPGRRLKLTLVVRDEKDDPSILDIVRVALEDGLRTPAVGTATSAGEEPSESPVARETIGEDIEREAREAIEEALAKVIEQFQATGKEPAFDPAKWAEQLSKLWTVIRKAKAAGVNLRLPATDSTDPATPAEGS